MVAIHRPLRAHASLHSLVAPCPNPPTAEVLHQRLTGIAGGVAGWSFWESPAPVSSTDPAAPRYVRREAERPLHSAQRLRVVLVRYGDGAGVLVLVADRATLSRTDLDRTANALATGAELRVTPHSAPALPRSAAVPAWGLGEPHTPGPVEPIPFEVPAGRPLDVSLLALAAAVVLSRYETAESPRVGVLDPDGGPHARDMMCVYELGLSPVEGERPAAFANHVSYTLGGAGTPSAEAVGAVLPCVGVVLGDAVAGQVYRPCLAPYFPLTLHAVRQPDGSVRGSCTYDPAVVATAVAEAFTRGVARVAAQLAAGGDDTAAVTVMPMDAAEASHMALLGTGPARERAHATEPQAGIHDRFREMVRTRADAVAVSGAGTELTFRRLDELAEDMAVALRGLGAGPGRMVGVCLERDPLLVVTLLAVLKAGCAYVPMDTRYPEDRLRYVTAHADVAVVVTDLPDFPDVGGVKRVGPQELLDLAATAPPGADAAPRGDGDAPAYVIYTSGSTGRPKGVVVPHRNVLALVDATEEDFGLGPHDVWTMFHSSAFDFSVWEIWGCLLTGGRLVVVPYWITRDTDRFHELLAEQHVTVLSQTPSAFGQLVAADRDSDVRLAVRLIVFGGEPLDTRMLLPWFTRYPPASCRPVNMFGITETTVHVTAETITPESALRGSRCVGRPLPGWSVSVRDDRGHLLPAGAAGEIWVGGAGVADGYLGQPELTAERFVLAPSGRGRIYRSGDKGRLLPDGRLEHLGRIDSQVKLRGFRIELDEIRHVLLSSADVLAAAVALDPGDQGDPTTARIDAYAVLRAGARPAEVLSHARRTLPDYMVPTTLTPVEAIPLTINGKLDASRLPTLGSGPTPAVVRDGGRSTPADAPSADPLEEAVLDLWRRRLGTEVGVQDNFFELGGNSLLVVRVIAELRELGLPKVSVQEFYGNSTAGRFVELVRSRSGGATTADRTN
ncbi:non-ribosomal peptide synthetase [Streptomyces sp. NPDC090077]|uniref:non-ribosomal peptide synthetase n=1 Tax=Streptomyces sp. NPDC090077 TaxID=3365938 RepID=UPI00381A3A59